MLERERANDGQGGRRAAAMQCERAMEATGSGSKVEPAAAAVIRSPPAYAAQHHLHCSPLYAGQQQL